MQSNRFYLSDFLISHTVHTKPYVQGYYIYCWTDCSRPFYIGMGRNRRAWNEHLPLPENRRLQAKAFQVHILRHCLTKPQAHLIERYYISHYTKRGIVLLNTRIPSRLGK